MIEKLFSVENKVIVITGGSKGIGKAVADGLDSCKSIVIRLGTSYKGTNGHYFECDITDYNRFKEIIDTVLEKHGRIDGFINNAGVTYTGNKYEPYPQEAWDRTMEVNLNSVFRNTQYVAEIMAKQGKGSVISMTSLNSAFGFPNNPSYLASKGGLKMLSKGFARDYGRKGLRFNCIVPGLMVTRLTQKSFDNPILHNQRLQNMMIGRWGQPEDIIGACIFLLSDASSYVTGQDIYVDGGWSANGLPFLKNE